MDLTRIKFLLDENVPVKMKQSFTDRGLSCTTIQDQGWSGASDKEIITRIEGKDTILITRDKDFTFLWQKIKLRIVYIAIEPAIFETIQPKMEELLDKWQYDSSHPFLIVVQKNAVRYWQ
jgi:predicted nuclease of predicted toxin-antitoxin system